MYRSKGQVHFDDSHRPARNAKYLRHKSPIVAYQGDVGSFDSHIDIARILYNRLNLRGLQIVAYPYLSDDQETIKTGAA